MEQEMRKKFVAAVLVVAASLTGVAAATTRFSDVPSNNVHHANIDRASQEGLVAGCAQGRYCPGDNVKRDQMSSFLIRLLDQTREDNDDLREDLEALIDEQADRITDQQDEIDDLEARVAALEDAGSETPDPDADTDGDGVKDVDEGRLVVTMTDSNTGTLGGSVAGSLAGTDVGADVEATVSGCGIPEGTVEDSDPSTADVIEFTLATGNPIPLGTCLLTFSIDTDTDTESVNVGVSA